ncbi:hypothetical protein OIU78_007733 [Salix suchowensis]|nr:hypothetical protein OIU78_007733 [Salix suchowensis]
MKVHGGIVYSDTNCCSRIVIIVEIDSKPPIVGDQKWDFMDLFLQYANSTWEDLLICLQCSKLLPVYNAMVFGWSSIAISVAYCRLRLAFILQMLCRFEQQHAKEAQFRGVLAALAPVRAGSLTL